MQKSRAEFCPPNTDFFLGKGGRVSVGPGNSAWMTGKRKVKVRARQTDQLTFFLFTYERHDYLMYLYRI